MSPRAKRKPRAWFSPGISADDAIEDGRDVVGECELDLTLNLEEARELVVEVVRQLSNDDESALARMLRMIPELIAITSGADVVQVTLPLGLLEHQKK